ncbi:MAG: hypothetical protein ACKO3W_05095, partial [bacterium]
CAAAANKQLGARNFTTLHMRGTLASSLAARASAEERAEALGIATTTRAVAEKTLGATNPTTLHCLLAEVRAHAANRAREEADRQLAELETRLRSTNDTTSTLAREVRLLRLKKSTP